MRRTMLMLAVVGLVATMASAATASSPNDRVTVGGQHLAFGTGPGLVHVGVSAHSGAAGEDPRGQFTFALAGEGDKPIHAKVTCLIVNGNDAIATGVIAQPKELAGQIVVLEAVDNGGPGSTPPDAIRFSFEGAIFEVSPGCWAPVLAPVDVVRGNVVVYDAT